MYERLFAALEDLRDWLNENVPCHWIARGGSRDISLTLPNFAPIDFSICGHIESEVCVTSLKNLSDLDTSITAEMVDISDAACLDKTPKFMIERFGHHQIIIINIVEVRFRSLQDL